MIDNTVTEHYHFKVLKPDNFYCTTTKDKATPSIDTLTELTSYEPILSTGKYEAYTLKSNLKTPFGYHPALIEIRDVPYASLHRFRLVINISHPKNLHGHNLSEIYECQVMEIVEAAYNTLLYFGIQIDKDELINNQNIRRVDFCKNVIIYSPVKDFITLLKELKKPRSKVYIGYGETIYFGTKKKKTCIYDKFCEVIKKASKDKNDITYQLVRELLNLQAYSNMHVIRVEQRLYGLQAIKEELKGIINPQDITFQSLFSEKIASHVLNKHWQKISSEQKFKTLLLGEKDVNVILNALSRVVKQEQGKNVNPLFVLYTKLLADIGEEAANQAIKGMRKSRTLVNYKKDLFALIQQLPIQDKRLDDYRAITSAVVNWDKFSLPINL